MKKNVQTKWKCPLVPFSYDPISSLLTGSDLYMRSPNSHLQAAALMEIYYFIFCAISCFCVRKMSPYVQIDMQVVPTEYRYLSKKVVPTNQFSVTEYFVPIRPTDRSWPGNTIRTLLPKYGIFHLFSSGLIRFLLQPFTSCMISRQSQSPSKKKDATSYIS